MVATNDARVTAVTQLLSRPTAPGRAAAPPPGRSPAATGAAVCLTAAALGLSVAVSVGMLAWAADPRSGAGAGQAVRLSLDGWLLAQHVQLSVPGGALSLPPLAITALLAAMLVRAGRVLGRSCAVGSHADGWRAVASLALPYAAVGLTVAHFARTAAVSAVFWQAAFCPALLAAVAGWYGLYRERGGQVLPAVEVPDWVRPAVRAGATAVAVLLVAGVSLTVLTLFAHIGRVAAIASRLRPGVPGGILLALLDGALAPNAAVAATAYSVGPGFAIGAGTRISPLGTSLHSLPAIPLLGAVPTSQGAGWLAMGVPVAAGVMAALVLQRRFHRPVTLETIGVALASGAVAGLLLAVTALAAGGAGGPGALGAVGASPWEVGLAGAAEVGLAAAAGVAAPALGTLWRLRRRDAGA